MRRAHIEIRGARTHNLRSIDADLPLGKITVVTGVSGSGKSSLAVDTLYAEAQRRFLSSLSAYARQFLERLERPAIERLDFVPPAIAIGQTSRPTSARASVGSMSQISDLLQLLWGAISAPFCPNGHGPIGATSPTAARAELVREHLGKKAIVIAPVTSRKRSRASLIGAGYSRSLDEHGVVGDLADARAWKVVVDRLVIDDVPRLAEALTAAFALGDGRAEVHLPDRVLPFLARAACATCGFEVPPKEARLFNPSSPIGACPACQGFGRIQKIDDSRVIPDPTKSLLGDAIAPWSTPGHAEWKDAYPKLAKKHGVDLKKRWIDLPPHHQKLVFEGDPSIDFPGVRGFFAYLETKRYKVGARIMIARYRDFVPCTSCGGMKLQPAGLAFRVDGRNIADAHALSIEALRPWLLTLAVDPGAMPLLFRLTSRLEILEKIGLGYLTSSREGRTLSGGEARRIHLSSALGAGVTGTLYVLDEPSIGLHARDTARLGELLRALSDAGNTVVVVEHDAELIAIADHVVELGPGAGKLGGHKVFDGTPAELALGTTATAEALRSKRITALPRYPGLAREALRIKGACARSLAGFDVQIPLGALTCITGVSGSGKSTLAHEVIAKNVPRALSGAPLDPAQVRAIEGHGRLSALTVIDTSPLARSTRSIPATYLDAWGAIRNVLASSGDAKRMGLTPRDFSFNSAGGRCELCEGLGTITVDMQFLDDLTMTCEACGGERFSERVLTARWHDLRVADVLSLTVDEAHERFSEHPAVRRRLAPLREVGLGYLGLGQTTSTLSGGEAQRLKLAAHLAERTEGHPVLVLDEPTTGLHHKDVEQLMAAFSALLARGATLVVVEHHLELIRGAHHVIDLGPEGGARGGRVVVEGTVDEVIRTKASHTGAALNRL